MSNHHNNLSADSHEPERFSLSSDEGFREQVIVPEEKLAVRDIHHVQNVVVGTQNIYQGTPLPPVRQKPIFMAAPLPPDFVARPHEFGQLKRQLLQGQGTGVTTITSTLLGAGGFGKTTLALALCHDSDIRAMFSDAILWVQLREQPSDPIRIIEEIINAITGRQEKFDGLGISAATAALKRELAPRRCLLVIDDVWSSAELLPLLQGASESACLITTRNSQVLPFPEREKAVSVDAMRTVEAVQLLCAGIDEQKLEKSLLKTLTAQLGDWPLLLTLANGVLRERIRLKDTPLSALGYLQRALEKRGVIAFDTKNASMRQEAVARTLEVSLLQLDATERERYEELAIFPEDVDIPLETISQFWRTTGRFDVVDTEELCQRLYGLSLLLSYDLKSRRIRLHDVIRRYLQVKVTSLLPTLHQQFLDSYVITNWADLPLEEPYLWEYLAEHLLAADRTETLYTTLTDASFLEARIRHGGVAGVQKDFGLISENHTFRQIASAVRAGAVVLRQSPEELWNQIKGRVDITLQATLPRQTPRFDLCFNTLLHADEALICIFEGYTGGVQQCAFSSNGQQVLSSGGSLHTRDFVLRLWDVESGKTVRVFKGHTSSVYDCAFSPDEKWILSTSLDRTLRLWDVESGTTVRVFKDPGDDYSHACAFSPGGKQILSALNASLQLWDVESGTIVRTFKGHTRRIRRCAFSPDGKQILSASEDATLWLWDVESGTTVRVFKGHAIYVYDCAFSPDRPQILSASGDKTLRLWDMESGKTIRVFKGHTDQVLGCAFSPNGRQVLSASMDRTLRLWDVRSGKALHVFRGHVENIHKCVFSPNGKQILSASEDATLRLWDVEGGKVPHAAFERHLYTVSGCAFSPNGQQALSASEDATLRLWDVESGKTVRVFKGHEYAFNGCAFSPDGRQILSASADATLQLWDVESGKTIRVFKGHKDSVNGCAFSPDGRQILSASGYVGGLDRPVPALWLWDVESGKTVHVFEGHEISVDGCAFSPDGKQILSASEDGTLRLWNVESGKTVRVFKMPDDDCAQTCAFSPDGKQILSASYQLLQLWDVKSGKTVRVFEEHRRWVYGCAFSPNGRQALSASLDKTLRLWDVKSGRELARWTTDAELNCCAFSPNGKAVIAGDSMGGFHFLSIIMK